MPNSLYKNPGFENIDSPVLRDFYQLWLLFHGQSDNPAEFDSLITEFGDHIPYVAVNDYDKRENRFRVKFFGSGYVEGCGQDLTNRFVDEINNTEKLLGRYMWSVQNKKPYLSLANPLDWSPKEFKSYDVLACPLFDEEDDVSALVFRIEFSRY